MQLLSHRRQIHALSHRLMHALSDIGLQLLPLNIIIPKPHQNRRLFFIQRKRIVHLFDEFR